MTMLFLFDIMDLNTLNGQNRQKVNATFISYSCTYIALWSIAETLKRENEYRIVHFNNEKRNKFK